MKKIMFNDRYGLTKAVLEGRKTMTRRLCNFKVPDEEIGKILDHSPKFLIYKATYKVGDIVAVAQSYKNCGYSPDKIVWKRDRDGKTVLIPLHNDEGWNNKMYIRGGMMPNRIRITSVRAERLQDITEKDCIKEGIQFIEAIEKYYYRGERFYFDTSREAFASLIDKVSGRGTWQSNPYVWVYEFELLN